MARHTELLSSMMRAAVASGASGALHGHAVLRKQHMILAAETLHAAVMHKLWQPETCAARTSPMRRQCCVLLARSFHSHMRSELKAAPSRPAMAALMSTKGSCIIQSRLSMGLTPLKPIMPCWALQQGGAGRQAGGQHELLL